MQIHHGYLDISQCSHNQLRLQCHLHHKSTNTFNYTLTYQYSDSDLLLYTICDPVVATNHLSFLAQTLLVVSLPPRINLLSCKSDASFSIMRHSEALAEAAEFDWLSNGNAGTWLEARVTQPKTENSSKIYLTLEKSIP